MQAWVEEAVGVGLTSFGTDPVPVIGFPSGRNGPADSPPGSVPAGPPLRAIRLDHGSVLTAQDDWLGALRPIVTGLHPDLLFSTFGAYELARVTLPDGFGIWGPVWYLFGDASTWRAEPDPRVQRLDAEAMAKVDYQKFWHCYDGHAQDGFGVMEEGKLVALAAVHERDDGFHEIGMDVDPSARGTGLGRAVVGTAGASIIANGYVVLGTTRSFNVPSARTLRSVGLVYAFSELFAMAGGMPIPPQTLGRPAPDAPIVNYYPDWAMNQDIESRPD